MLGEAIACMRGDVDPSTVARIRRRDFEANQKLALSLWLPYRTCIKKNAPPPPHPDTYIRTRILTLASGRE